jgi:hypothetical protein
MPCANDLHGQIQLVCQYFHSRVGLPLLRYETAVYLRHTDAGEPWWEPWDDLPIRFHIGSGAPVGVAWSKFSDLWIDEGRALPFPATGEGDQYRWVTNSMPELEPLLGGTLHSANVGRDPSLPSTDIAFRLSHRLLLEFDRGWLEVFILYAARSETSSNSWNFRVINEANGSA